MKHKIQHIIINSLVIILLAAIALPNVVKLAHVFEDHKHEVCINPSDYHFHEVEIDCEFYKFKVSSSFTFTPSDLELLLIENNHKTYFSYYNYLNSHQQLSSYSRGPPNLM